MDHKTLCPQQKSIIEFVQTDETKDGTTKNAEKFSKVYMNINIRSFLLWSNRHGKLHIHMENEKKKGRNKTEFKFNDNFPLIFWTYFVVYLLFVRLSVFFSFCFASNFVHKKSLQRVTKWIKKKISSREKQRINR